MQLPNVSNRILVASEEVKVVADVDVVGSVILALVVVVDNVKERGSLEATA